MFFSFNNPSGTFGDSSTVDHLSYSIENNSGHMCNGELSLHVLDIIQSIMKSAKSKKTDVLFNIWPSDVYLKA